MLIQTHAKPPFVIVDPVRLMPRYWAVAWTLLETAQGRSDNTLKLRLRHIDKFYRYCDEQFGLDSFDAAMSARDVVQVQAMAESFYVSLTADPNYNTTVVQCWDVVGPFIQSFARRHAPSSNEWLGLSVLLLGMHIRIPKSGRFEFARALPPATFRDLMTVVEPMCSRNPFHGEKTRYRNYLIVRLLAECGLRRGEVTALPVDALHRDVDPETGELMQWLNVRECDGPDPRYSRPRLKTTNATRSVPVTAELADLYDFYVSYVRVPSEEYPQLLTSRNGRPLSVESVTKLFHKLYSVLTSEAQNQFFESTGGKEHISPHDLRHTCATRAYRLFMQDVPDRELALSRMRTFFGWSIRAQEPEHYARAAIHEDVMASWNRVFGSRVNILRSLNNGD